MTPLIAAPAGAYVRDLVLADRDPHSGSDPLPLPPAPPRRRHARQRRGRPVPPELPPATDAGVLHRARSKTASVAHVSPAARARAPLQPPRLFPPLPRRGTRRRHPPPGRCARPKDAAALPRVACHASRRVDAAAWRMWTSTRTWPSLLLCESYPAVFPSSVGKDDTGGQELVAVPVTTPVPSSILTPTLFPSPSPSLSLFPTLSSRHPLP